MTPADSSDDDDRQRKPISVRDGVLGKKASLPPAAPSGDASPQRIRPRRMGGAMDAVGAAEESGRGSAATARTFKDGETEWIVRLAGAGRSGTAPDPGVPLMHLTFSHASDPEPVRDLLVAGRGIESLYEEELRGLLARSRLLPKKGGSSG